VDADHWSINDLPAQVVPPRCEPIADAVTRLEDLLARWAPAFAVEKFGTSDGIDLRGGRRGLLEDEAASFLRGLDAGLLTVGPAGAVVVPGCRPKPGGGRYSLFSANRYNGDLHVTLNLEYVIQLGTACELVIGHGWSGVDVQVEVGEFDAVAYHAGRVVLALEAKARVDGPDSLLGLWRSLVAFSQSETPPDPTDNHKRKYVELLRLTEMGPVVVWLVAAGARWPALATRTGARVAITPVPGPQRQVVIEVTATGPPPASKHPQPVPNLEHAAAVALLTDLDACNAATSTPGATMLRSTPSVAS
jgi:hypothetical protein